MRKKTICSVGLLVFLGLALAAMAGKGGAKTVHGTTTYRDDVNDRITSDWRQRPNPTCVPGNCPYVSQQEGVKTVVNSNGEWRMDTKLTDNKKTEGVRKIFLDFTDLDAAKPIGSNTALPWGMDLTTDALEGTFFRRFSGFGTNLWDLEVNVPTEVDMFIVYDLPEDGVLKRWWIRFGPGPDPDPPCPDSDPVIVTRTADRAWTIESDVTASACLVSSVIGGGAQVREVRGFYRFPFSLNFEAK